MKSSKLFTELKDKQYRDAFVSSAITMGLPYQIRALRAQRHWKQEDLTERSGMKQSRISAIETPGKVSFTLETLRRLASAFDVALLVKFVPFSELVKWEESFEPDAFFVPPFEEDAGFIDRKGPAGEEAWQSRRDVFYEQELLKTDVMIPIQSRRTEVSAGYGGRSSAETTTQETTGLIRKKNAA